MKLGSQLLTQTEVAELLGLSRKTLSSYKSRKRMPEPDVQYGRTPLWKIETITNWRKANGTRNK